MLGGREDQRDYLNRRDYYTDLKVGRLSQLP